MGSEGDPARRVSPRSLFVIVACCVLVGASGCRLASQGPPQVRAVSVAIPSASTPVAPYVSLDDTAYSICEMGRQGRFVIGTGGVDSIRCLEPDGSIRRIHDFKGDPAPMSSCWWRGRFCMGFVNHGRLLIGDGDGQVSYVDTGARQLLGMLAARDGAVVMCAMFQDADRRCTFSLVRLEEGGRPRPFAVFAEGVAERQGKPIGIVAQEGGRFLVSAGHGTDARQGILYEVANDGHFRVAYGGLTGPGSMVRWDRETVLITELDFRKFPYGGRVLALSTDGSATVIANGFLGLGQLCLASDRSLLIAEHPAGSVDSRSVYRLTDKQLQAALAGQTLFVPKRK